MVENPRPPDGTVLCGASHRRCPNAAEVLFVVRGGATIPRCTEHAGEMRQVLRSYLTDLSWTEEPARKLP
jgi:hypothetical protein